LDIDDFRGFYANAAPLARIINSTVSARGQACPMTLAAMMISANRAARDGVMMVEAMVYIALLGIVLIIASQVFNKGMNESAGLQRNVADIERAIHAGERWRADVRSATGAIQANEQSFTIPQKEGAIVYEIRTNQLRRIAANRSEVFLADVKDSKMIEERRGNIVGWRWELELQRRRKEVRVRPLFTFMAVPGGAR
jgi:Tfp pilus assembly protein PilE